MYMWWRAGVGKFRRKAAASSPFFICCIFGLLLLLLYLLFQQLRSSQNGGIFDNNNNNIEFLSRLFNIKKSAFSNDDFFFFSSPSSIILYIAVESSTDLEKEYAIAHQTIRFYSAARRYPLVVVDFSANATLSALCPQNDFMFRRHCALAHFLHDNKGSVDWALFLDADIAVINPTHSLEEYLPLLGERKSKNCKEEKEEEEEKVPDLIFYERIFNGEFVAGSYFARNTNSTIDFLHFWADYNNKLPWSWHGSDNGAIHAVFLDLFCPNEACATRRSLCSKLWRRSKDDDGLRMFTECARSALGKRDEFVVVKKNKKVGENVETAKQTRVRLVSDFRRFWARDIWLTGSEWSERDFLLHGLKRKWQNSTKWGGWFSPFTIEAEKEFASKVLSPEKLAVASKGRGKEKNEAAAAALKQLWPYEAKFEKSRREVDEKIFKRVQQMRLDQMDYWRRVEEFALEEEEQEEEEKKRQS